MTLRIRNELLSYPGPKYVRESMTPGHCFNLSDKLNKKFSCNDFSVYRLDHHGAKPISRDQYNHFKDYGVFP
jgi:hypothetical protein